MTGADYTLCTCIDLIRKSFGTLAFYIDVSLHQILTLKQLFKDTYSKLVQPLHLNVWHRAVART